MRNKLFVLGLIVFILFSCKKNDSSPSSTTTQTKTDTLVQQPWKFNNAGVDINKDGTVDLDGNSQIPACVKDNTATFSANGSGTQDEGATKCNSGDPQTSSFTWSFTNNETQMNINGGSVAGMSGQFKILKLDANQFSVSKDTVYLNQQVALIVNLKH